MTLYQERLPEIFPVVFIVRRSMAVDWAEFLTRTDEECLCGSSFAVTSDTYEQGNRRFWLSAVSMGRLVNSGRLDRHGDIPIWEREHG
jgi:hypothetical protein